MTAVEGQRRFLRSLTSRRRAAAAGSALFTALALLPLVPAGAASSDAEAVYAFVANAEGSSVTVLDTSTGATAATIPVLSGPTGVAISPDGSRAYVGTSGNVTVIDTSSLEVTATVPVSRAVRSVAISPDGKRAYASDQESDEVSVIDTATNTLAAAVPVPGRPIGLAVSPDSSRVYVTSYGSGTVSVIDAASNAVVSAVGVGTNPQDAALSPDGTRLYVVVQRQSALAVLDTATNAVLHTIGVGAGAFGVAVAPGGARVYVMNQNADTVSVVDPEARAVVATIPVGSQPLRAAFTSDGAQAYVTSSGARAVSVIDTATGAVVRSLPTGATPYGIALVQQVPAQVTQQPIDQRVHVGDTATFTAAAAGNPAPTVQWQSAPPGSAAFTDVSGATSPSYTTSQTTPLDDGTQYRAVFSNTTGGTVRTATTRAAVLTVTVGPAVTKQPTQQVVVDGATATFSAAASGTPQPTVQWQSAPAGSEAFTDIAGATALTYATPASSLGVDGTRFRAVFSNPLGTATTAAALLSVQVVPSFQTSALPDGRVGQPYTATIVDDGHPAPTEAVVAGALPPGLALRGGSRLSGTPTAAGTFRFTLRATNAAGRAERTFAISVAGVRRAPNAPSRPPNELPETGPSATGPGGAALLLLLGATALRLRRASTRPLQR